MYFKQILNERCGCASYVIASRKTGEAAIVDPASDLEPYDALLRDASSGCATSSTRTSTRTMFPAPAALPACMGRSCACMKSAPARPTHFTHSATGTSWSLGDSASASLHTPGRRPELISLLDRESAAQSRALHGSHRRFAAGRRRGPT